MTYTEWLWLNPWRLEERRYDQRTRKLVEVRRHVIGVKRRGTLSATPLKAMRHNSMFKDAVPVRKLA